ncbi:hypothetical protein AVEN_71187-1 [Araneus ventricosus]|uniref:Uncharacterized protein n=1 Tax=Araneus ventricosus TaxID=182803 RepID=A0A4Y2KS86_ARAVE|nr:hypothetical protein AVEN_71187-1 [Araneus ventricosus]
MSFTRSHLYQLPSITATETETALECDHPSIGANGAETVGNVTIQTSTSPIKTALTMLGSKVFTCHGMPGVHGADQKRIIIH